MLLTELVAEYIAGNPSIGSAGTVGLYKFVVQHFAEYLGRTPLVDDLTGEHFAGYLRHRKKIGRAASTCQNEAKKLLCVWRYAARRGVIPPPGIKLPRIHPAVPHAYLRSELRRMFRSARRSKREIGGVPVRIYFIALLSVAFDSGERIAAVLKTTRDDYDLRGRWVTFRYRKQDGRMQTKRLRRSTARAIRRLFEAHNHDSPFGFVHFSTVYYHQSSIQLEAGLPVADRRKFHAIRKSHASYLHVKGGDSTDSLGHSSDEVTREIYHDPRITRRKHAVDYLFNPLGWWERFLGLWEELLSRAGFL